MTVVIEVELHNKRLTNRAKERIIDFIRKTVDIIAMHTNSDPIASWPQVDPIIRSLFPLADMYALPKEGMAIKDIGKAWHNPVVKGQRLSFYAEEQLSMFLGRVVAMVVGIAEERKPYGRERTWMR